MKRRNELFGEKLHDPYMDKAIYRDLTVCPNCGLVFHNKRWTRDDALSNKLVSEGKADLKKCPACRKAEDRYPLGIVVLSGDYLAEHKDEIMRRIHNEAALEEKRNPLARIINEDVDENRIEIHTTTESLARRLGRVVWKAFHGDLKYIFSDGQKLLRVDWHRE